MPICPSHIEREGDASKKEKIDRGGGRGSLAGRSARRGGCTVRVRALRNEIRKRHRQIDSGAIGAGIPRMEMEDREEGGRGGGEFA